jgi:hypothetical protein
MGVLGKLLGEGAAKPIEAIGGALDSLFTSDEERLDKQALLERLRQRPMEMQDALNLAQLQHRSLFVAGPRPFIMWICGFALGWHFIGYDLLAWASAIWFPDIKPPVLSGTADLITVTMALLGLGGLRTIEKAQGLTR